MEARMEAMRAFAMADPDDCDKEWAAYLALVRDKATPSIPPPTNSTPPMHNHVHDPAVVPGLATTRSAAYLHATSSTISTTRPAAARSASTAAGVSRSASNDDLSPEARRIYDYLVGNSAESIEDLVAPTVVPGAAEDLAAPAPSTCSTVCRGGDTSATTTPSFQTAVAASPKSTPASPTPAPTTCSSECPSKDASASTISSATPSSSATSGNISERCCFDPEPVAAIWNQLVVAPSPSATPISSTTINGVSEGCHFDPEPAAENSTLTCALDLIEGGDDFTSMPPPICLILCSSRGEGIVGSEDINIYKYTLQALLFDGLVLQSMQLMLGAGKYPWPPPIPNVSRTCRNCNMQSTLDFQETTGDWQVLKTVELKVWPSLLMSIFVPEFRSAQLHPTTFKCSVAFWDTKLAAASTVVSLLGIGSSDSLETGKMILLPWDPGLSSQVALIHHQLSCSLALIWLCPPPNFSILMLSELHWQYYSFRQPLPKSFAWYIAWLLGSCCADSEIVVSEKLTNMWILFNFGDASNGLHLQHAENACCWLPPARPPATYDTCVLLLTLGWPHVLPCGVLVAQPFSTMVVTLSPIDVSLRIFAIPWNFARTLVLESSAVSSGTSGIYSDNLIFTCTCYACVSKFSVGNLMPNIGGPWECVSFVQPKPPWSHITPPNFPTALMSDLRNVSGSLHMSGNSFELHMICLAAWYVFCVKFRLKAYYLVEDSGCLTSQFTQRAYFLMQWEIPWLFSCYRFITEENQESWLFLQPKPPWLILTPTIFASAFSSYRMTVSESMHIADISLDLNQCGVAASSVSRAYGCLDFERTLLGVNFSYHQYVGQYGTCFVFQPAATTALLKMQSVGANCKIDDAFLCSWDVTSTLDMVLAIQYNSGMFSLALHEDYFAAVRLLLSSPPSRSWVLYLPVISIMQCGFELMLFESANPWDDTLTYTTRVLISWDPGGINSNSNQLPFLHLTWDPGIRNIGLRASRILRRGDCQRPTYWGWPVCCRSWATACSGATRGNTRAYIREGQLRGRAAWNRTAERPRPDGEDRLVSSVREFLSSSSSSRFPPIS